MKFSFLLSAILVGSLGASVGCKSAGGDSEIEGINTKGPDLPYKLVNKYEIDKDFYPLLRAHSDKALCFGDALDVKAQKTMAVLFLCDVAPFWDHALFLNATKEGNDPNWYLVRLTTKDNLEVGLVKYDKTAGYQELNRICTDQYNDVCDLDFINHKIVLTPKVKQQP